jgi:hypothetical protein
MVFRNASGDLANLNKGCSCLGAGFHLHTDTYLQLYTERKSSLQQALPFTFQAAGLRAGASMKHYRAVVVAAVLDVHAECNYKTGIDKGTVRAQEDSCITLSYFVLQSLRNLSNARAMKAKSRIPSNMAIDLECSKTKTDPWI